MMYIIACSLASEEWSRYTSYMNDYAAERTHASSLYWSKVFDEKTYERLQLGEIFKQSR